MRVPRVDILFRCRHYIVVNKPAGLFSQPGVPGQVTVLMALRDQHAELFDAKAPFCAPKSVHRLDARTTGCMAYGTSAYGVKMLSRGLKYQTKGFQMQKWYAAILDGPVVRNEVGGVEWDSDLSGTIRRPIDDKPAITRFLIPKQPQGDKTLAFFNLVTGRKHQIRRHCIDVLRPIVGEFDDSQLALHSWRLIVRGHSPANNCNVVAPVHLKRLWQGFVDSRGYILPPYCEAPNAHISEGTHL